MTTIFKRPTNKCNHYNNPAGGVLLLLVERQKYKYLVVNLCETIRDEIDGKSMVNGIVDEEHRVLFYREGEFHSFETSGIYRVAESRLRYVSRSLYEKKKKIAYTHVRNDKYS